MSKEPKNFSEAIEELERATCDRLRDLEETIHKLKPELEEQMQRTKTQVEGQMRENPWVTLGIAGLLFFILGFFLGNQKSRGRD